MSFDQFVATLAANPIELQQLKVAQLAQAMLESGRGTSQLFLLHRNPYGMKYRPQMAGLATSVSYTDSVGETDDYCAFASYADAVAGYWRFIDRPVYSGWRAASTTPDDYLRFIAYAGYVGGPHSNVPPDGRAADRVRKNAYIAKCVALFAEARQRLSAAKPAIAQPAASVAVRGKGVFIDVGHGAVPGGFDPGAPHHGSGKTEHALNRIAANACHAALTAAGIPAIIDDRRDTKLNIGRASAGYDVFVSVHHNSAGGPAQGAEAFAHATAGTKADKALAAAIAAAMAGELGIADRGGKTAAYTVLNGARQAKVRAAVLAELYFMHDQSPAHPPPAQFEDWSARGGKAIARAVTAWLEANP